jgi:hypothetical protein
VIVVPSLEKVRFCAWALPKRTSWPAAKPSPDSVNGVPPSVLPCGGVGLVTAVSVMVL